MDYIYVEEPEKLNLAGLFVMRLLEKNLQNPHNINRIKNLKASIVINAGEMSITLVLKDSQVKIKRGQAEKPDVKIEGSLESFLKFALGANLIRLIISRQIKVSGNPLLLLKLVKLMRTDI